MTYLGLRYYIWLIIFIFLCSVPYFLFFSYDELHPSHISSNLPFHSEWQISGQPPIDTHQIFDMPFVYLSEGGQSFVFSSSDQKYVLKLFKFRRFRPNIFVKYLPNFFPFKNFKDKHISKREQKLISAFNGYKLAYELHQKESGLIAVQLNPSHQSKWVTVIDKQKNIRKINLENVSFVLQEQGEMLSVDLSRILDQGNTLIAKQRIEQILKLYLSEYLKGIYDLDHGVMHNIGCIDGRLFHLDVGKFVADERIKQPQNYEKDLIKIISKLQIWINKRYPQYSQELTNYMNERLSHILNKNINLNENISPLTFEQTIEKELNATCNF